jgi:hypothetical protein
LACGVVLSDAGAVRDMPGVRIHSDVHEHD